MSISNNELASAIAAISVSPLDVTTTSRAPTVRTRAGLLFVRIIWIIEQGRKASVTWHARIADVRTPWVSVVVEEGDMEKRTELTGVAPGR